MSRIGSEISRIRKEKGMTQKQLGKLVGVSEGFIDEVEAGKRVLNGSLTVRIYKVLGQESDKYELFEDSKNAIITPAGKSSVKAAPKPVQQVWTDALDSILKNVPIYDYKMDKAIDTRQLPVVSNKVEGCPKEKAFFLKIDDNDMIGFRIAKGDMAFACSTQKIETDGIFFIEYNGKRAVRQIKKLDGDKLLLVSNKGTLATEMVAAKDIKVIARFIRIEITL